ncbi:MAG: ATP-binding protein [Myxococcota bacterium]
MNVALPASRGRVLLLGSPASTHELLTELTAAGYFCAAAEQNSLQSTAAKLRPEAIVLATSAARASEALREVRADETLRHLPVLAEVSGRGGQALRRLGVDELVRTRDELTVRLSAAIRAKRLVEREEQARRRMEALLEITQAATSSLELEQILGIAVEKIGKVISSDRCSVVLVEGEGPRVARVVASHDVPNFAPFALDLVRYPELRRALETRSAVQVDDVAKDPLMAEVRPVVVGLGIKSVMVHPLVCHDDLLGAIFLRLSRSDESFTREDSAFAQAVAAALANSIRNARLHTALKRKREDLESAYVDRYRDLLEANQRLRDASRIKDELMAVCSHDLRAPLQVLLGHGRLLLDGGLPAPQKSSVEAVVRMGRKILELVESLLERGRGDGGRLGLDPRPLDIAEVCKETTAELEILAAERGVSLRAETPESLVVVGDEVKMRQVVQNLMTNAIHHARASGEVVLRVQRLKRPDGDAAKVMVQDDGQGVSADQLQLLFDKYHQGKSGVGLGLTICKDFIELHGGEIWAEATEGGGSTFVFTLPLARPLEELSRKPPPQESPEPSRVLVVEDEPEVAAVVAEILRSRYRVEVARDGEEGVAKAHALRPDLVVMDVFLPKLDGLDAAVALKQSPDTAEIPVILLSAHQGVSDKVRALNLGAVDYLGKPFQAMELLGCADRAIRLSQAEKELSRSRSLLRKSGNDPETGLFDRVGLLLRLDQELSRARRYQRPLAVAVLTPGAPVGDKLRAFAAQVRLKLRSSDVVGHLGEGRLAVLLPESTEEAGRQFLSRLAPEVEEVTGVSFRSQVRDLSGCAKVPDGLLD